nr:hypothetical protein [Tanacetum cinerariifolium]
MEVVMGFVAWRCDEGGSGVMRCAMMLMAWIWWPVTSGWKLARYGEDKKCGLGDGENLDKMKEKDDSCIFISPMYEEDFNAGNQGVSKCSTISDNLQQHDTQPTLNNQPTLEPIIPPKVVNAEENNNNQAKDAEFKAYEFINLFALLGMKVAESFLCNIDTSNMHTFYQRHRSD